MINTSYNAWIVPIDEEIAHAHFHLPWMFVSDVCLINCIRLITTIAPNRNTITAIMEPNITINHVWVSISSARLWFIGCLQMRITTKKENEIKLIGSHSVAVLFVSAAICVCWITSYILGPIDWCADPIVAPSVCWRHRCRFGSQLRHSPNKWRRMSDWPTWDSAMLLRRTCSPIPLTRCAHRSHELLLDSSRVCH